MPCFKGLAVSIHSNDQALPEHSIQRQSRVSRISCYIPVPPPKIPEHATSDPAKLEQSTFAISITLLTPGLNVPYSAPKPTLENPYPQPVKVGGLPSITGDRGRYASSIAPYLPLTTSPNETIAAYIYFDGRPKEEVATLLRRGEETWVNSRWVSVPASEGGGLAEREFLFREVGLERWLNGLDLEGKDAAAKIEKRRVKLEKKRRRRKIKTEDSDEDEAESSILGGRDKSDKGVLRYGDDSQSPLEQVSDHSDDILFSDSDDSDEDPIPESAGQIKVALYRVLASGDIRRGEYSPQFDAHEGDDDVDKMEGDMEGSKEEVDHTTGFAKPKTLDPKTISTQTVTGIDPQERPFAVFTFWYRGEKQLKKMNIIPNPNKTTPKTPVTNSNNRKSLNDNFSNFKPLDSDHLKKFSTIRDPGQPNGNSPTKTGKNKRTTSADDSDEDLEDDDTVLVKAGNDHEHDKDTVLSPEDRIRQGELADGVQKIKLKRQHSAEDTLTAPSPAPANRHNSPPSSTPSRSSPHPPSTSQSTTMSQAVEQASSSGPLLPPVAFNAASQDSSTTTAADSVGSPLKKARASLSGMGDGEDLRARFGMLPSTSTASGTGNSKDGGLGLSGVGTGVRADVLGNIEHDRFANAGTGGVGGGDRGDGASGHTKNASFGSLLGGMLANGGAGGPASGAATKEVKMEEDEEL